jgi:nucleoside-diphosphate-sugar epimerase
MTTVLVTGATGMVGRELLDQLRRRGDVDAVGTSRRGSPIDPDVVRWHMAADPPPAELRRRWDVVVNTAADVRWTLPPERACRANVATVAALRPIVAPSTRVVQVSTAYAVGRGEDVSSERLANYRNTYEWSKASAERLAHKLFRHVAVVRPSLVIGRRSDGRATRFAGMYTILRGIATSAVPALAADPAARFDLVPVDDLAGLIVRLALSPDTEDGETATIVSGRAAPRVERAVTEAMSALNSWRVSRGHEPLPAPRVLARESWHRFFLPFARQHLSERQNRTLDLLREFEPYLAGTAPLSGTHTVGAVDDCLRASVRYWAETNPRLAQLDPRPWRA